MVMLISFISICLCFLAYLGGITAKCRDEDTKFFSLCPDPEVSAAVGERLTLSCARTVEIQGCDWYYRRGIYDTSIPVWHKNLKTQAVGKKCTLHLNTAVESTGLYQCMPRVVGDSNPIPLVETKLTVYTIQRKIEDNCEECKYGSRKFEFVEKEDGQIKQGGQGLGRKNSGKMEYERSPDLIGLPRYDNNIIHLKEGARNELKCTTRNGTPPPRFSWFIGYEDVTSYAEEEDNMSTLKLHKMKQLSEYHTKTLFCQVNHPTLDAPARFNASLDIQYEPRLLGAMSTYTASVLDGQLTLPFEVTTNPELSTNDYMLIIENPHGLVEHKLRAGEQTFSKTYSLSQPERVKSTDSSLWKFNVSVSSVTEEVLNNIHHIQLTNREGMQSQPYSFRIRLKTDTTKLATLLAAAGVCVLLVLCFVVYFIKKRNKKKRDEAWKLWTSDEKLRHTLWDTLPYLSEDPLDVHSKKKQTSDEQEEKGDDSDPQEDSDEIYENTHTCRSKSSASSDKVTVDSTSSKRTAGTPSLPQDIKIKKRSLLFSEQL